MKVGGNSTGQQTPDKTLVIENIRASGIRIVGFGGSNTYAFGLRTNYGLILTTLLSKHSTVPVFHSMAGQTVALASESQERFINDVLSLEPAIVIFEFGSHERDFQVPPDRFYNTMKEMIQQVRRSGGTSILIAPTLVQTPERKKKTTPYLRVLSALAKETTSIFIDPGDAAKNIKRESTLFHSPHDAVHWSAKGHEFVAKLLYEAILKAGIIPLKGTQKPARS